MVAIEKPKTPEDNIPVHIKKSDVAVENPPNLDVALSTRASEATLSSIDDKLPSLTVAGNKPVAILEDGVGLAKSADLANLDVALSTRASESTLSALHTRLGDIFTGAVSADGSIAAADNIAGFNVYVNNDFRTLVEFRCTLGGAGDIEVQISFDGTTYYTLWTKSLTAAGTYADWDFVAAPYFRINVPTTGIDVEIDIRAIKA